MYVVLAAASVHSGTEPDLLDEVATWQTDDFWQYAMYAAVAYIRAAASRAVVPVARRVPEAARLLRPGGRLVFHTVSALLALCSPEPSGPARQELLRPQRDARRLVTAQGGVQFHPSHGEWITILRATGFAVDDLREIYAPPDATDHPYYQLATAEWARRWPVEENWAAHLAQ